MNLNKFQRILKNFKSKIKAFTLIEMLVTLGIITALSSMILVYSRRSERVSNLIREGDHIVFELQRAQGLSMLVLQQDSSGEEQVCGWGIYVDQTNLPQEQFVLFSDLCTDTGSLGEAAGNGIYDDGEEVETISLLKGVEIFESNISSITFIPPEPRIKFYPDIGDGTNADIKIQLKNQPGVYYEIQVSEVGQIYKQLQEI